MKISQPVATMKMLARCPDFIGPVKCGVYSFTHVETGAKYIGSSRNIGRRVLGHLSMLLDGIHDNSRLQEAWDQRGGASAFSVEIVEETTLDARVGREQHYIDVFAGPLFNIQLKVTPVRVGCSLVSGAKRVGMKGVPTFYPNKVQKPVTLNLSSESLKSLDYIKTASNISRSDVLEHAFRIGVGLPFNEELEVKLRELFAQMESGLVADRAVMAAVYTQAGN